VPTQNQASLTQKWLQLMTHSQQPPDSLTLHAGVILHLPRMQLIAAAVRGWQRCTLNKYFAGTDGD